MKVVAFNGSAREKGNTDILIREVLKELEGCGVETEVIHIGGKQLRGCVACMKCFENKDRKCIISNDNVNEYIAKALEADGIILGSPSYYANVSPEMKALIDRLGLVATANNRALQRKVGVSVVAVRRGGAMQVFDCMNHLFQATGMVTVGSTYWNFAVGMMPGDVNSDKEGMENMKDLGKQMTWLLNKIKD